MSLKLYGMAGSTCTQRVLATLFEKGVTDFEVVTVDLRTGAHKTAEFLKMQPFGLIPVLVDGPLTLFESRAISRYLAAKFDGQGTPLFGPTGVDKPLVDNWLEVESQNYNPAASAIVSEKVFKPMQGGVTNEAAVEASVRKLGKVLDVYEARLTDSKYLAGDYFSLADLSHLSYTHHLVAFAKRGDLIEARPHVQAWWADISSRPAWKQVLALGAQK